MGYIAHEQIIGISKLTRLVRLFASRFIVQGRIGRQVADALEAMLHPHGIGVTEAGAPRLPDRGLGPWVRMKIVPTPGQLSAQQILNEVNQVHPSDIVLVEGGPT